MSPSQYTPAEGKARDEIDEKLTAAGWMVQTRPKMNLYEGAGRARRTIPAWIMRQLRRRDHGCRFPGCHHQRWVNAHHVRFWVDGGPTDLDNLILLCPFHHRMLHEYRWAIEGDPNGPVIWIKPDGHVLQ